MGSISAVVAEFTWDKKDTFALYIYIYTSRVNPALLGYKKI